MSNLEMDQNANREGTYSKNIRMKESKEAIEWVEQNIKSHNDEITDAFGEIQFKGATRRAKGRVCIF